jgi:CRISPR-associated protein Csb1
MGTIDLDRINAAVADDGVDAGIKIATELEPLAGDGATVKPAVYSGGRFQVGRRWWGEGDDRRKVDTITIDNVPSQANRLEVALERLRPELGLPELVLDLTSLEPLPPHVPRRLSSFRFPHRNADAYLRDAELGGVAFTKTDIGKAIFAATGDNADALVEWFPQALLYGFWQSHLGKKGSQAKLARSWVSEIIGVEPATGTDEASLVRVEGTKGDPYNLVREGNEVVFDEADTTTWQLKADSEAKGAKGTRLSEIGHGQVPVAESERALGGVSFAEIAQQATVSFSALRRVRTAASEQDRALLVALGLVAHSSAFGRAFHLRSGADLRPRSVNVTWLGANGDERVETLDAHTAIDLFRAAVDAAEKAGSVVGSRWPDPLTLEPKPSLRGAIRNTYPEPDDD